MRILFVHNQYLQSSGGEDTALDAEIKLLQQKGHIVEVLFFRNAAPDRGFAGKVRAAFNSIYNSTSKQLLKNTIRDFNPDIVHVHNFFFEASPSVFDAAFECQVPIVLTVHNYRLLCVNAMLLRKGTICEDCIHSLLPWKGILRKCYHNSASESAVVALIAASHKVARTWTTKIDRYITPSAFIQQKLLGSSLNLGNANKITVKGNFIDDPGTGKAINRENYFLFIGRLSQEKGIDFLLNTFAKLKDEKLLVAGDGPDKEVLASKYYQNDNIIFTGRQNKERIIQLLKKCQALVFPSVWYEGLPLTIIEALATGTPVIASNIGAMQEMISPGYNGLLFSKENEQELVISIETLKKMSASGNYSLHEGARETYINRYHPEACYRQIIEIYNSVIIEHQKRHKRID